MSPLYELNIIKFLYENHICIIDILHNWLLECILSREINQNCANTHAYCNHLHCMFPTIKPPYRSKILAKVLTDPSFHLIYKK